MSGLPAALPLSIVVSARDGAGDLDATIRAVRDLTDDLVVESPGDAGERPPAEARCRHPWLLRLEAGEIVPPDLAAEIRALFAAGEPKRSAWRIGIAEIAPAARRPHRQAATPAPIRLYRTDAAPSAPLQRHDGAGIASGRLHGVIHRAATVALADQLDRLNRETDAQADSLAQSGAVVPSWRVFVALPATFLASYLGRRHVLRGASGFRIAVGDAVAGFLRAAKHYERRRRQVTAGAAAPDRVDRRGANS